MARRRRLNKKVAIIGLVILVVVVLCAIALVLHFSGNPYRFIEDGEKAAAAQDYEFAERSFKKAINRARKDPLKIEILFKLADVFLEQEDWKQLRGCWESIVHIEPTNVKARLERLRYNYIIASSGVGSFWQQIESEASEFLEVVDKNLFSESPDKWESFDKLRKPLSHRLDSYLYLLRGRARLEMARRGVATMPEELCEKAIEDLKQVQEIEPNNTNAGWYLAQSVVFQGENQAQRGDFEARQRAEQQAQEILNQCIDAEKDNADAHINLLSLKLMIADKEGLEAVKLLEPEFLSLVQRFDSEPLAFRKLADYYLLTGPQNIGKAVEAIDKAVQLDKENIGYLITATRLYYYKFSINGRKDPQVFEKSVSLAKNVLKLPGAQDTTGPRTWENTRNRLNIYSFLASRHIEQIVEPIKAVSEPEKQQIISSAEQAIHEIEQIIGSGENINVTKWEGMLEFAKGNRDVAVKKMYTAYQQFMASGENIQMDPQLPYLLAKAFENTSEQGAVTMFLASALQAGIARWEKPEAILDYSEALVKLENWATVVSNVELYEQYFGPNQRSRSLLILAYIGAGQFDEALEKLASEPPDDVNTIKLRILLEQARVKQIRATMSQREIEKTAEGLFEVELVEVEPKTEEQDDVLVAELASYEETLSALITKLLALDVSAVEDVYISTLCEDLIFLGKIEEAENLVGMFLQSSPDNINALFYKRLLSEPNPNRVSIERRNEIEESVLKQISDTIDRAMNLGFFYSRNRQWDKAVQQYKEVLGEYLIGEKVTKFRSGDEKIIEKKKRAVNYLFVIVLQTGDWELAERLKDIAQINNLDGCEGNFYEARLAVARKESNALTLFDDCLKQRPVFSYAYLLRSNVHAALGNQQTALEDARKAASLNPLDGTVAKNLAAVLYQRNQRLGKNVTLEQQDELKAALGIAMRVNPGNLELYSFYSQLISSTEPDRALAIRQYLLAISPTVENAVLLGEMVEKMAVKETDERRKEAFSKLADLAYQKAVSIEPNNQEAIFKYTQFLRNIGRAQEAEKLLKESKGRNLLWTHYYQIGQYEQAEKLLRQLYENDKTDISVLKGLLFVAEKTSNKESAKKYSEELLSIEDNIQNRLMQIKVFLNTGLVKEAEYKLQSFREKYPDEPTAQYIEAWLLMKRGRLKQALDMASRSIESDSSSALAWQLRGQIYLLMADYEKAINDFDQSKVFADEPQTSVLEAKAYLGQGREEYAITELKGVIDSPQTSFEARSLLERIYLRVGRKQALGELYQDTLKKFPDSIYWLNQAARFALQQKDLKVAEQLYNQAWQKSREHDQGDRTALNGYLEALLRSSQLDKLFVEAKKYVDTEFATIALLEMAEAEMMLGNKETAIKYARQAADKTKGDQQMMYQTLIAMYKIIGKEDVEMFCNDMISENPDDLPANLFMYNSKFINKNYDEAVKFIDKCIEIVGADVENKNIYTMKKAGTLYLAYKKTSDKNYLRKAIIVYESLIDETPKNRNADVLNNLAYVLAEDNENLEKALEYAKQAYEQRPNNPEFLDTYAYILYKSEKYSEAEEFIYEAIQQFQVRRMNISWNVYERLGNIKDKLGAKLQAIAAYQQALEAGGDDLSDVERERIRSDIERLSEK